MGKKLKNHIMKIKAGLVAAKVMNLQKQLRMKYQPIQIKNQKH